MEALLINFLSLLFAFIFSQLLLPLFVFFTEIKLENIFFCEYVYFIIFIIVFLIGSVLSGLYPAFLLSSYLPIEVLKGKLKSNKKGLVIRKGLVVFQFSISFLLIASTIVVFFQLEYLKNRDLGFNQEQILVVRSPYVIKQRSKFPEKMLSFKSGLSHNSNIKDISVSASIPGFWYNWSTSSATREGSKSGTNSMTYAIGVSESYIPFYKLKLIEGTNFLEKHESFEVCILSETALKSFGFENAKAALGKKIIDIDVSNGIEIVGVIKDYYHFSAKESPQALILIYDKSPWGYISFKVNVNNLESVIADIKKQFEIVFPNNPFEYFFLDDNFNRQYQNEKQFGKIFSLFSMFALFVALLGQFGLVSFNVVQRAKEIGVRKIMGATPLQIVVLLSKDFGKLLLVAFIISIPVSYFSIQVWLYSFTYRISPSPIIFLFTAILISLVAFLTSAIESYKTAITNPVKSLKSE
jgi:putative ABC transport system permease protein